MWWFQAYRQSSGRCHRHRSRPYHNRAFKEGRVIGKFVEFFGRYGNISVEDRATVANMCLPEYGATVAYFPVDEKHWITLEPPVVKKAKYP